MNISYFACISRVIWIKMKNNIWLWWHEKKQKDNSIKAKFYLNYSDTVWKAVSAKEGREENLLLYYQVTTPVWSLPLGQCAAYIPSNWLIERMWLLWNMSSWSKWNPSVLVSGQDSHAENVLMVDSLCVCVYSHIENEISWGIMGFWGCRGSRACDCAAMCLCVCLCARVCACMLLQVCVGMHALLFRNSYLM